MGESIVTIKPFLGLDQRQDKNITDINGLASKAVNVETSDGTLKRVKGTARYGDYSVPTPIETLMVFYQGTYPNLMTASNGKIYKLSGGAFVEVAAGYSSNVFDYMNYQIDDTEIIIYTNGVDNVKVYDGTTVRDLKLKGNASAAASDNKAPIGKFIEFHKERVWLFDDLNAYFSASFDPDDFTAPTDPETVNTKGGQIALPTWDGGIVIGARNINDDILVFKSHSVHKIFGSYPGNYQLVPIFNMVEGSIIDKTICTLKTAAFWTTSKGIEMFDGVNPHSIKEFINEEFNSINKDYIQNARAVIYDDRYIIAVPKGVSTKNNMVIEYNINRGTFLIREGFNVNTFILFRDKLLYADDSGKLYEYNTGNKYDTSNISSTWETGKTTLGDLKAVKTVWIDKILASGNGTLRVSVISDKKVKYKDIALTSTEKLYKVNLTHTGYTLQFKFENLDGSDFKVINPQFNIYT